MELSGDPDQATAFVMSGVHQSNTINLPSPCLHISDMTGTPRNDEIVKYVFKKTLDVFLQIVLEKALFWVGSRIMGVCKGWC